MTEVGLWFVSDMGGGVIKCFLAVIPSEALTLAGFSNPWVEGIRQAGRGLRVHPRIPYFPARRDLSVLLRMIPPEIAPGCLLPCYVPALGGGMEYWESQAHYVFREGSAQLFSVPFLTEGDPGRVTGGYVLTGLLLLYSRSGVAVVPSLVPVESDPHYGAPYYFRDGTVLRLPVPSEWAPHLEIIAERNATYGGGYWYTWQARCRVQYLWCYPPVSLPSDMRHMASQEHLEALYSLQDIQIIDDVDDAPTGISWLPEPTYSGAYRELNCQGYGAIDRLSGHGSVYPAVFWRPCSRPVRTIPVRFPPVVPLVQFKDKLKPGGVLVSIADKLLTINGLLARVRRG